MTTTKCPVSNVGTAVELFLIIGVSLLLATLCGCSTTKQAAGSVTLHFDDPAHTNRVTSVEKTQAETHTTSVLGGLQSVGSVRASAGKTMSVGAKDVAQDAASQIMLQLLSDLSKALDKVPQKP